MKLAIASDVHLEFGDCILKNDENADVLILAGDIMTALTLRMPSPHLVADRFRNFLKRCSFQFPQTIYIPGNHDEVARQFVGMTFGEIQIKNEMIHFTADGKKLWVTHGDLFDSVMQYAKWLAYVGDTLYTFILWVNRWFNKIRVRLGLDYWSLSQYLKHSVKNAVNFIADFEHIMAREARLRDCDGVVCGHIHKAEIREIDGLLYCNDGDWVESLSALVEDEVGEHKVDDGARAGHRDLAPPGRAFAGAGLGGDPPCGGHRSHPTGPG